MITSRNSLSARTAALVACLIVSLATTFALSAGRAHAFKVDPAFGDKGSMIFGLPTAPPFIDFTDTARRPTGGFVLIGGGGVVGLEVIGRASAWTIAATDALGRPDGRFGQNGQVVLDAEALTGSRGGHPSAVAVQADGKILVGGVVDVATPEDLREFDREFGDEPDCNCSAVRSAFAVARFNTDGSIDTTFGDSGVRVLRNVTVTWADNDFNSSLKDIEVDESGRILILGHTRYDERGSRATSERLRMLMFRLGRDGGVDGSYGTGGRVLLGLKGRKTGFFPGRMRVLPNNKVVAAGGYVVSARTEADERRGWASVRLSSRGKLDKSYGRAGVGRISLRHPGVDFGDASIDARGRVTYAGARLKLPSDELLPSPSGPAVGRLTRTGRADRSFGGGDAIAVPYAGKGAVNDGAISVATGADGSVEVLTGMATSDTQRVFSLGRSGKLVRRQTLVPLAPRAAYAGQLLPGANSLYVFGSVEVDGGRRMFASHVLP